VPFLPDSFTGRMKTIEGYEADQSANVRLAVWGWTWDYAKDKPLGGGFGAFLQNKIEVRTVETKQSGGVATVRAETHMDQGRAYHSSYFEMLGEQGFPGLILFLLIHGACLARMEIVRRRYRKAEGTDAWIAPLATALQHFQIIYLVGSVFVGIAYQPFPWLVLAIQIGFDATLRRRERAEKKKPFFTPAPAAA
jgi:O-antigen ligase